MSLGSATRARVRSPTADTPQFARLTVSGQIILGKEVALFFRFESENGGWFGVEQTKLEVFSFF